MIEREATVKISSELLANLLGGREGRQRPAGARRRRGLLRGDAGAPERQPTPTLLPIATTVIIATQPESAVPPIEVER